MGKSIRIIARMDIKGPHLVKGIHLEGLRVLGTPEEFAKHYYEHGADELFYQDVVASLYGRNSLDDFINKAAMSSFIPMTVGGGIRTIADITRVLRAGADKVSINTAGIQNPQFIKDAVQVFGSSTIIVAIEAIRDSKGNYLAYTDNGREYTGVDVYDWAKKIEELGAGEICLTSVDRDGTNAGFDIELVKNVSTSVNIPVIAHGGAGTPEDIAQVVTDGRADAVALSSIIHYDYVKNRTEKIDYNDGEGNTEFLKRNTSLNQINSYSIETIKNAISKENINCRI
jgi:imidazole glycerol-phosphate synthase subunit HisF